MEQFDLCVIGAGAGGLLVTYVAARLGFNVVLVESGKMGGDCLNYGCVPSKSLLSVGKAVDMCRHLDHYGFSNCLPGIDYAAAMRYVQSVIETIEPNDSVERFEALGTVVMQGRAVFVDKQTVRVGNKKIRAKRFVIATGSKPFIPPIPGLPDINFLTNETLFSLRAKPRHLLIIGAGPIGCEMAQAHLMLGCDVTVLDLGSLLPKDDTEAVAIVKDKLLAQGLQLHEKIEIKSVSQQGDDVEVQFLKDGQLQRISCSHLLVATGRAPNVAGLQLEKAQIMYSKRGIVVDSRLRASNKHIYAIGDVTGRSQFTHVAGYQAGIVIRNLFFKVPAKVDYKALPWVTYCQPELAQVGMTELMAKSQGHQYQVLKLGFDENDRAQTEGDTTGFIKVLVSKKRVIGVTIVGANAGELLLPWSLVIQQQLKLSAVTSLIAAYPTRSELSKRVAGQYFEKSLFSKKTSWLAHRLFKWFP